MSEDLKSRQLKSKSEQVYTHRVLLDVQFWDLKQQDFGLSNKLQGQQHVSEILEIISMHVCCYLCCNLISLLSLWPVSHADNRIPYQVAFVMESIYFKSLQPTFSHSLIIERWHRDLACENKRSIL